VLVRSERVNRLLGTSFAVSEIGKSLRRVSASVKSAGRGGYRCRPPSYRSDLGREEDFVEEVARLVGYDRIPETVPRAPLVVDRGVRTTGGRDALVAARAALRGAGLTEMVSVRFVSVTANRLLTGLAPAPAAAVEIQNPLGTDLGEMRKSAAPGLLAAARRNENVGETTIRAFEIGTVFWRDAEGDRELLVAAGLVRGPSSARGIGREDRPASFYDAKGAVEALLDGLRVTGARWLRDGQPAFLHPGKSALVAAGGDGLGYVGGLHPRVARELGVEGDAWLFELDLKKLAAYGSRRITFRSLPRFPAVFRDLAVVADEALEAESVIEVIAKSPDLGANDVRLFDVYRGAPLPPGKKSLAYSIAYRAPDRTLTDDEVNDLHRRLVERVTAALGVTPRM
jgi:phenylalanyl-tRNA synthetase beta chain